MQAFAPDLQAAFADLKAQGLPATPTGRPAFVTRRRRPLRDRPRIARRFVPSHSLGIPLDWGISSSTRLGVIFLISRPREGLVIHDISAGLIAGQFGVTSRTAWRWLREAEDADYIGIRPGLMRGSLVITLLPKAVRLLQLGAGDISRPQKTAKPTKPPASRRPRTISSPCNKKKEKKEAEGVPMVETHRMDRAMPVLAKLAALARAAQGTSDAAMWQRRYNDLAETARKAALLE